VSTYKKKDACFTRLSHDIQDTPAWLFIAQSGAVPLLLDMWRRHNGHNNGQIPYSQREAEHRFGCSPKRAVRWFHDLQEAGFIVATYPGSFNHKTGERRARRWRLTMERCGSNPATRDYLRFATIGGLHG
jgi:hypothetical protein